jgi:tetratricopeptide (TPR) repeat protein
VIDRRAAALTSHGEWTEARAMIEHGLAALHARGDRAGEARLVLRRGRIVIDEVRHRGGDGSAALADLEAARRTAEAIGDRALVADSVDALAMMRFVHWFSSQAPADLAAADEQFRQALAIREPRGDSAALADSHFHAGLVHQMRGERGAAKQAFAQSLAVAERVHDDAQIAYAARHLGYLADLDRDPVAAEALLGRSLALRERSGPGPGVAAAQIALAEVRYAHDGDAERALALLGRAHDGATAVHSGAYAAIASGAIGRVHRDLGHYDEARRWFTAAIAGMDALHSDEDVPESYEQLALIELLQDQPAAAAAAAERGIARRTSARLRAVQRLAQARARQPVAPGDEPGGDPVVVARLALVAGRSDDALTAAITGDDPDTLLLAALAVGPVGLDRAIAAASAISRAQALRFERVRAAPRR